MATVCEGNKCVDASKAEELMKGREFDFLGYFKKNAGRDGKLSWREIQKAPFALKKAGKTDVVYKLSKAEFNKAQSSKYDSDSKKLNFWEFSNLVYSIERSWFWSKASNPFPSCEDMAFDKLPIQKQAAVRRAIRQGITTALKHTWRARKKEIWAEIKKGNLAKVTPLLYKYLPIVATLANSGNPRIYSLCQQLCAASLYEIEELASKKSLKIKTIKRFWRDVGRIYNAFLKKAKKAGVTNLNSLLGSSFKSDIQYNEHGDESQFTLLQLLEKIHPRLVKRMKNWRW